MRPKLEYRYVAPNTAEFQQLQAFAETFDHKIVAHPNINVYAVYRDGILFGYLDHVFVPVAYPAFHPEFTRPQDVVQVMMDFRAHCQFAGKPSYVGVPLENNFHRGNFPERVMQKLGLVRHEREIYSIA